MSCLYDILYHVHIVNLIKFSIRGIYNIGPCNDFVFSLRLDLTYSKQFTNSATRLTLF